MTGPWASVSEALQRDVAAVEPSPPPWPAPAPSHGLRCMAHRDPRWILAGERRRAPASDRLLDWLLERTAWLVLPEPRW